MRSTRKFTSISEQLSEVNIKNCITISHFYVIACDLKFGVYDSQSKNITVTPKIYFDFVLSGRSSELW